MNAFAAFLDERPGDEPWFCEPCDKDPRSEFERQRAFVNYMRKNAHGVMVVAIPNGSNDSEWTRLRKWAEGAVAGMTDLALFWPGGAFFPEMKGGNTPIKQAQRDVMNRLHRMGYRTGVYRNPETLIAHLREAGAPFTFGEML